MALSGDIIEITKRDYRQVAISSNDDDDNQDEDSNGIRDTNDDHGNRFVGSGSDENDDDDDDEDEIHRHLHHPGRGDDNADVDTNATTTVTGELPVWEPTGHWYYDLWHFCGPGWLISIAYVDPGNYQADIQAGATTRYALLWTIFWTSILSIYVQVLCVRLGYRTQLTLAQVQAQEFKQYERRWEQLRRNESTSTTTIMSSLRRSWRRYFSWFVAEFSVVLTDLPEVIGFGIACNLFFGWPYWVGVIGSLLTTMVFLATMNYGMRVLEGVIFVFVGVMSIALFIEMGFVGVNGSELVKGWFYGFVDASSDDLFAIVGILGAVVMPHNLYLHTGTVQTRKVKQTPEVVNQAIRYCSIEPVVPIFVSFFVNMAIVAIAAERVYGTDNAENVGLTDFCLYFQSLEGGCVLWAVALISAGQSSAITTTFTGQFIMDGYLELRIPTKIRAVVTRLVAITPCVLVAAFLPTHLNQLVNIVNASLAFLLPFALSPLIKYNCSPEIMGQHGMPTRTEKIIMYTLGILAWFINAVSLSAKGGGFFGDHVNQMPFSATKVVWIVVQVIIQIFYFWWNYTCLFSPVVPFPTLENAGETDGIYTDETVSPQSMDGMETHEGQLT